MWNAIDRVLYIGRQYSIRRMAFPRPHEAGVEGSSPSLSTSLPAARAEELEGVSPKIPAKPPRGGQVVGLAIAQVSPQCFAKTFPLLSSAHRRAHRLSVLWITG